MKVPLLGLSTVTLLSACSPGLDLYTPPRAQDYVALCARDKEGLDCQAILPVLRTVEGEVTVLLRNGDDRLDIARLLSGKGVTVDNFLKSAEAGNFARAHIFLASKLQTGQMRTLDGKLHEVKCEIEHQMEVCAVDGIATGFNKLEGIPGRQGSVYLMNGLLPF